MSQETQPLGPIYVYTVKADHLPYFIIAHTPDAAIQITKDLFAAKHGYTPTYVYIDDQIDQADGL